MAKRIPINNAITLSIVCLLISCTLQNKQKLKSSKTIVDFSNKLQYNFLEVDDTIKMAYLDIGRISDPIVLLLHGEPNSSFVYRNIAPSIAEAGFRVIIPDLVGFGYSDKPNNPEVITYTNHTKWLNNFLNKLELYDINLFAHDWGAMISLRIVAEQPDRFKKVAISYGYLFEGTETMPESFKNFRQYAMSDPNFSAGNIMNWGSYKELPDSIKAKYDEPFNNNNILTPRTFPSLIPDNPKTQEATLNRQLNLELRKFNKPFITIWGNHNDPMWIDKDSILQQNIPGAKNQTHYKLESNHFIQEDKPEELVEILVPFFQSNSENPVNK